MDGAPADMSQMTLRDVYLKPWKKFFGAGGRGAMLSHNSINGIPAHMHKQIMTGIIRTEWNHSKVFFASDAGDIDSITKFKIGLPAHARGQRSMAIPPTGGSTTDADVALLSINAGMVRPQHWSITCRYGQLATLDLTYG
jgi:beta-glucosidase-like glycosyl hydrolase